MAISRLLVVVTLYISLLGSALAQPCEKSILLPQIESSKDKLILSLLALSIGKEDLNGDFCFKPLKNNISDGRESWLVERGEIDVTWSSASGIADDKLWAIQIPIFKGLLGFRIFVIRSGDQTAFDTINSLDDLKKKMAGQGAFWGDTRLLKQAGFNVTTSTRARNLWGMLATARFDYLPLAVHEPWQDLEIRPELKLTVEKNILLEYPSALFFYVSKDNQILHNLISLGMKKAIADGSYDQLLHASEMIQSASKYANIKNRRVISLSNPEFYNMIPQQHLKYWLTPKTLRKFLLQN